MSVQPEEENDCSISPFRQPGGRITSFGPWLCVPASRPVCLCRGQTFQYYADYQRILRRGLLRALRGLRGTGTWWYVGLNRLEVWKCGSVDAVTSIPPHFHTSIQR